MSMKVITLDNLTRFAAKLKDHFVQIKDSVRSVNHTLPDANGNIAIPRVDWANELESSATQSSDAEFTIRTSGGEASIDSGNAWLNAIYGKSVKTGYVMEETTMAVVPYGGDGHITATIDWDTFKSYVDSTQDITLLYVTDWSASPALYGITVTGTPVAGDEIQLHYVKLNPGTITTASPTAFNSTGWNLYESTNGYAHVIKYSDTYGFRIDGTYTSIAFATTPTGTGTTLTVTDHLISGFTDGWTEGYIIVTGGSTDTAIYMTWSDWTDGYVSNSVPYAGYTKSTISVDVIMNGNNDDVDGLFPYGLASVGSTRDEINLNLKQAIRRIDRMTNNETNMAIAEASGRAYDYDTGYIYIALETPVTTELKGAYAADSSYTVSDHGLEYFDGSTVAVPAYAIYGASLKNKLERDVLTLSQQTLTNDQKAQVCTNIGAMASNYIYYDDITYTNVAINSASGGVVFKNYDLTIPSGYKVLAVTPISWSGASGGFVTILDVTGTKLCFEAINAADTTITSVVIRVTYIKA